MRLRGKVAVVTGAGSGIGRAIAIRFAAEGARVVVADIDENGAFSTVRHIEAANGSAVPICADVSNESDAAAIIFRATDRFHRVDLLVNNAACFVHKRVEDATPQDWQMVMAVNVVGTSIVSKNAVARMKELGGGAIVNIASINGLIAMPNWMTYNASKAAVIEMSKSMAVDLAPHNIRVNCVCPGVTHTPALENVFAELSMTGKEVLDQIVAPRCLIKRYATADDIAAAALYLASDEASYVTGTSLVVDGGYTA